MVLAASMAQTDAPDAGKTLTGKVIDALDQTGIADARVEVQGGKEAVQAETSTGPDGGFHIDLPSYGRYQVTTRKEGYSASLQENFVPIEYAEGKEAPAPVVLVLHRSSTIRGAVVSESDDRPLASFRVEPYRCIYLRGRREPIPEGWSRRATTKIGAGTFELAGLPPGEYFLEITSGSHPKAGESFADTNRMMWPAGDIDYAPGLSLSSGADLDVGKIKLRQSPLTGIDLEIASSACEDGRQYQVDINEITGRMSRVRASYRVSCPKAHLQLKLSPGKYQVSAVEQNQEEPKAAAISLEVTDRDAAVEILPQDRLSVAGRVALAETDNEEALQVVTKKLQIGLWSGIPGTTSEISVLPSSNSANVRPDGVFTATSYVTMRGGITEVETWGLPAGYYVKKLVYNGSDLPGRQFALNADALQHNLRIILSNQGASFHGQVRDQMNRPVSQSKILLVPWPADSGSGYPADVHEATADASGAFSFSGLRPEDCRVVAVRASARERLEQPGRLMSVLSEAKSINLQQGQNLSMDLTLAEQ